MSTATSTPNAFTSYPNGATGTVEVTTESLTFIFPIGQTTYKFTVTSRDVPSGRYSSATLNYHSTNDLRGTKTFSCAVSGGGLNLSMDDNSATISAQRDPLVLGAIPSSFSGTGEWSSSNQADREEAV